MQGRRHNHIQPLRPDNWLYLENKSMESPHTDHDIEIFWMQVFPMRYDSIDL
jgi:hypothetical protein